VLNHDLEDATTESSCCSTVPLTISAPKSTSCCA
jgi:hypothetical protein